MFDKVLKSQFQSDQSQLRRCGYPDLFKVNKKNQGHPYNLYCKFLEHHYDLLKKFQEQKKYKVFLWGYMSPMPLPKSAYAGYGLTSS